ncbi:helix-turn-helix domain-containing protein [Streptomyces sp. NPDC102264]|uniref:helix-turn-helix domain-containing protein n=1 Tax=Streptomyces sp. NPDC102264 TaxID=3366149 RepID=UPI00380EDCFC
MPANRQQRQHNPLTSKKPGKHKVSKRQHRQRTQTPLLTPLTSADARSHPETPGQRVRLTLLTPPGTPATPRSHAPRGLITVRLTLPAQRTFAEPLLYRVTDAMRVLSMSRSVVYDLIRTGRLRTVKQGRTRLIPVSAITDYVALLEREAGEQQ